MTRTFDLMHPGDVFTRLTIVKFSHRDAKHRKHYRVRCVCGKEKTVQATLLRYGNTRSCGCLAKETKLAQRLPSEAGVINQIILQYKRHASDRKIVWCLSPEQVGRIVRMPCHYCGVVGGNTKKTKNHPGFRHNGIDRVDSSLAYTIGNVVPCCGMCNRAKRDIPRDEFIAWARRIASHQAAMADQWGAPDLALVAAE